MKTRIRPKRGRPRIPTLFERIVTIEEAKLPKALPGRCPFCGDTAIRVASTPTAQGRIKAVACMHCGARGPEHKTAPRAKELWRYGLRVRVDTEPEE